MSHQFLKTYKLTQWGWVVGLPLIAVLMCAVASVAIACFEPTMTLECPSRTECKVSERTWLTERGPASFDPTTTTFELERSGKQRYLRIKGREGVIVFATRLSNAGAVDAKTEFDRFIANPNQPTMTARAGVSPLVPLVFLPVLLLINFIAIWALSGDLIVDARPGVIRATRVRIGFRNETVFRFSENEKPAMVIGRYGRQHAIVARSASRGDTTMLATSASRKKLQEIYADLAAFYT